MTLPTVLRDTAALQALAPEWAALWARTPGATPFQHPAWLLPWWAAFGTERPLVALLREDGRLSGVLPAYVLEEPGGAVLLPIGAGTTDMIDVLGAGAAALLAAVLAAAGAAGVGRCAFLEVPPGSALRTAAVPPGWSGTWSEASACPVLHLVDIPAGQRRKLRMSRNRAERAGGWTVEAAGPAGLPALVALHAARWRAAGEAGVLADPAVRRCLEAALPLLDQAGLLRLAVLTVGGVAAAAVLALLAPGRIFFYLQGYDAGQAFVSPGTLLVGAMLEQAAAEGRTEAHFLRGREAYKYAWGAVDRMNVQGDFRTAISPGQGAGLVDR